MPIRVPNYLPALETLNAEQVDVMPQEMAARQDIRPLRHVVAIAWIDSDWRPDRLYAGLKS